MCATGYFLARFFLQQLQQQPRPSSLLHHRPLHACVSARTWAESNVPGGVSSDVGVLDFAPNTGMTPLSAKRRGASTSAASRPMGSQRNILLLNFLVEGRRHEHPPPPTNLKRSGDRPIRLSNEGNDTRRIPPTCQEKAIIVWGRPGERVFPP